MAFQDTGMNMVNHEEKETKQGETAQDWTLSNSSIGDMLENEWPSITEIEQFLKCGTNAVKKTSYSPEWCGSVAWTPSCKPKSHASVFLSFSFSLPPPLSEK